MSNSSSCSNISLHDEVAFGNVTLGWTLKNGELPQVVSSADDEEVCIDLTNFTGQLVLRNVRRRLATSSSISTTVIPTTIHKSTTSDNDNAEPSDEEWNGSITVVSSQQTLHVASSSQTDDEFKQQPLFSLDEGAAAVTKTTVAVNDGLLQDDTQNISNTNNNRVIGGSPLHAACAKPEGITLSELRACLQENPQAPQLLDELGRTPAHILSSNELLFLQAPEVCQTFLQDLLELHPSVMQQLDDTNHLPGTQLLTTWIERSYVLEPFQHHSLFTKFMAGTTTRLRGGQAAMMISARRPNQNSNNSNNNNNSNGTQQQNSKLQLFPKAELSPAAEWALTVLSTGSELASSGKASFSSNSSNSHQQQQQQQPHQWLPYKTQRAIRETIAQRVAQTPLLLQTILLIENGSVRQQVLEYPIVRRAALECDSVGPWLLQLIRKRGIPSKRGVDYLTYVSHLTVVDYIGTFRTPVQEDDAAFVESKAKVMDCIGDMGEILPSLCVLEQKEIERAAASSALWHVMHEAIKRPFVIGIVMIDFILHLTLMLSFRSDVKGFEKVSVIEAVPEKVVNAIAAFYIVRKISEALALLNISRAVLRSFLKDPWNLFDLLAVVMVLCANTANNWRSLPAYNGVVLALLWLKVLGFLKAINVSMATFILALLQIVIDIRFFLIVLLVFILMFADMMDIVFLTSQGGLLCENVQSDPQEDFCSSNALDSVLRMYAVLIGDFEVNDYRQSGAVTAVFLMFTMFGVIIMLNVLIAVVSDSYEKSTIGAKNLFGRARVGFLAEHLALEQFLQPGTNPIKNVRATLPPSDGDVVRTTKYLEIGSRIFRWAVLLALVTTALFAEVFLVGQAIDATLNQSVFLAVLLIGMSFVLTIALWSVMYFLLANAHGWIPSFALRVFSGINVAMSNCINLLRIALFGDFVPVDDETDEWSGRMNYIENLISERLKATERNLAKDIAAMSRRS